VKKKEHFPHWLFFVALAGTGWGLVAIVFVRDPVMGCVAWNLTATCLWWLRLIEVVIKQEEEA
jgi:hypothetical protein